MNLLCLLPKWIRIDILQSLHHVAPRLRSVDPIRVTSATKDSRSLDQPGTRPVPMSRSWHEESRARMHYQERVRYQALSPLSYLKNHELFMCPKKYISPKVRVSWHDGLWCHELQYLMREKTEQLCAIVSNCRKSCLRISTESRKSAPISPKINIFQCG